MKRIVMVMVSALVLMVMSPAMAHADRPDGFGIGLGVSTTADGVSGKIHTGGNALQGVVGCWYFDCRALGLSLDYLWSMPTIHDAGVIKVGWNLGGGVAAAFGPRGWRPQNNYWDRRSRSNVLLYG